MHTDHFTEFSSLLLFFSSKKKNKQLLEKLNYKTKTNIKFSNNTVKLTNIFSSKILDFTKHAAQSINSNKKQKHKIKKAVQLITQPKKNQQNWITISHISQTQNQTHNNNVSQNIL